MHTADVPAWVAQHLPVGERAGLSVAGTWARGVGDPTGLAKQFVDFTLGAEGQKIVNRVGFVAVK